MARFRVDLSSPSAATVAVDYATAEGTAKSPADYQAASGTVFFSPGQTSRFIDVSVQRDALDEVNERYTVEPSNPQFAGIADDSGLGTIVDDDPAPTISINDTTRPEGSTHGFTVSISAPSGQQVKVDYASAGGSAKAPGDYAAESGTLVFAPGRRMPGPAAAAHGAGPSEPAEKESCSGQSALKLQLEPGRVDRREPVELIADLSEQLAKPRWLDQAAVDHRPDIVEVEVEAALDLGEGLRVEVEIEDLDRALAEAKARALAPARQRGDEVDRRRELDVEIEPLLELGDHAKQLIGFGLDQDLDVDGRGSPALEHGRRPARQVEPGPGGRSPAKLERQPVDPLGVSFAAHARAPARS